MARRILQNEKCNPPLNSEILSNEEYFLVVRDKKVGKHVDGGNGREGKVQALTPEEIRSKDNRKV